MNTLLRQGKRGERQNAAAPTTSHVRLSIRDGLPLRRVSLAEAAIACRGQETRAVHKVIGTRHVQFRVLHVLTPDETSASSTVFCVFKQRFS